MPADGERYFLLIEPALEETRERPGGLFRVRTDKGRLWVELFEEPDLWRQAPSLIRHLVGEDVGAVEVPVGEVDTLIGAYPWPGMRTRVE